MTEFKYTNRLIHASSPYLLQHAHNPVDWYEWGDEAFEKAKREDKLVLVSIGYSACHWCHVMEHECFEKEDTAKLMNKDFVCIKVDREERPDVDHVYMDALQLMSGQGGWPLNCFTLPDGRPLYAGTYFPKTNWENTLKQLVAFYHDNRENALQHATELTAGINQMSRMFREGTEEMSFDKLSEILDVCKTNFDLQYGGYNWFPKFPLPGNWEMFMQFYHYSKDEVINKAVQTTLVKMQEGGIYDHLGGGFARYSTDKFWKAPHFEKMLYDNAQLMSLYAHAFQQTKDESYKKTVYHIHSFLVAELMSSEGGFFSALDADTEGEEGKYYVWKYSELQDLLGSDEPVFSLYYHIDMHGNWEHGNNILHKTKSYSELEKLTGRSTREIEDIIERCRNILMKERAKRTKPGLDDKMITSWNALMIKGYIDAYMAFGDDAFLNIAKACADFILKNLWKNDRLYRIYKNGKATIHAFAEDYAILCESLIKLFEAGGDESYAWKAKEIMDISVQQFYDEETGLFYFKATTDSRLIAQKIDVTDNVIPCANSVFAKCMYLLGFLFDEHGYHKMTERMLLLIQSKIESHPTGYANWIQTMMCKQKGLYQVIVTGKSIDADLNRLREIYLPGAIIIELNKSSGIPLLKDKPVGNETAIYICRDKVCGLPQKDVGAVLKQLA